MTKKEQANRMRADGLTYKQIGKILGVSYTLVYNACNPDAAERKNKRERERYHSNSAHREKMSKRFDDLEYRCRKALYGCGQRAEKYGYAPCNATVEQLMEAFTDCCHKCGVAESDCPRRLYMDHCHDTGDFRGWLCDGCNTSIGRLGDNPQEVWAAYAYLHPSHAAMALQAFIL